MNGFSHLSKNVQNWIYNNRKPLQIKEIKKTAYKLTEDKAYILGVIGPGDGFIIKNTGIALSVVDEDFAEAFKKKAENVYGIKTSKIIEKKPTGFGKKLRTRISIYATRILQDLKQYKVNFHEPNWRIPKQIKNAPKKIKCAYISGFADSQGCTCTRSIVLASKNERGVYEMLELIKSLGLRATKIKRKDTNIIAINSRKSLENFYKNIGFNIIRKQDKLKYILSNYKNKNYTTPRSEIKLMKPTIIKLISKGYSQSKIAKCLGISNTPIFRISKNLRS